MSLAAASNGRNGEPDAKKFRCALPTQVSLYDMNQNQGQNQQNEPNVDPSCSEMKAENSHNSPKQETNEQEPILNGLIKHESEMASPIAKAENEPESPFHGSISALLEQAASAFFKNLQQEDPSKPMEIPTMTPPPIQSHQSMNAPIPGALAVAATPAAQLFEEHDWSWHRNPAAAIRSGGTNKQTPVWKYFVYNKVENLSRCIIGECTYMLKGPHTSTLACHLKKHPAEYAEFQHLKVTFSLNSLKAFQFQLEYSRDRNVGTVSNNGSISGSQRNGRASSAASNGSNSSLNSHGTPLGCNQKQGSSNGQNNNSPIVNGQNGQGRNTPSSQINNLFKKSMEQSSLSSIFNNNPLLAVNNIMGRQPMAIKNPGSMNELLNNLSARAVANMASQQNSNSPTPSTNEQPLQQLPFMNLLKQNNGIFGPTNNGHFDPKQALLQQQSKKWSRQDRKQREMETKLALVLCSLQIPMHKLNDPFLRDFLESLQPKFQLCNNGEPMEQMLAQMYSRALSNMKVSLSSVSKFTLMISAIKNEVYQQIRFSISVAYFSQSQQRVEVILLGIRQIEFSEIVEKSRQIVSQALSNYELSMDQVSKTILDGFEEIGIQNDQLDFPNQLCAYRRQLYTSIQEVLDQSEICLEVQGAVNRMVQSFCGYPEALMRLSRLCGTSIIAQIQQNQPFEKLAQILLENREPLLAVCCQQLPDQLVSVISESQWAILDNLLRLKRISNAHMEIVQENSYSTIDRVVPSIMQFLMTLEKDFPLLESLPEQLTSNIQQKLAYILNPQADGFDSSFIQATALNPQLVVLLDENQLNCAKSQIEKSLNDRIRNAEESVNRRSGWKSGGGVDSLLAAVVGRKSMSSSSSNDTNPRATVEDESSKSESLNNSTSLYPDLVQAANQRRKQIKERNQNGKNHYAEAMIQAYFEDALNNTSFPTLFGQATNIPCQPLQFWQMSSMKCSQLSELAIELLGTPSSAIPPEFILNPAIEGGSTLLLDDYAIKHPYEFIKAQDFQNLERDAIIRFNRSFWQKSPFP